MNNCSGLTCGGASSWLKCLLTAHSGFILSVPEAEELLTSIQSSLEERTRHLGPVYQLVGKLEMLDKQIREKQETGDTETGERGPLLLYQDDSGDELENVIDDLLVPASETDEDDWEEGDQEMESEQESDDCKIVNESDDNDDDMSDG